MNFLLKHKALENNIQIDKDKAFPVVGAETGIPAEIGISNSPVADGQSLDYVQ
jgi:L,D-transpeptidase ErfK/SrfK